MALVSSAALEGVAGVAAGHGVAAAGAGAERFQHIAAEGHVGEIGSFDQHVVETGVEGRALEVVAPPANAASTSLRTTRPPGPVP